MKRGLDTVLIIDKQKVDFVMRCRIGGRTD